MMEAPNGTPVANGANTATRKLALVRVQSSNLFFGCLSGILEDSGQPVTLNL